MDNQPKNPGNRLKSAKHNSQLEMDFTEVNRVTILVFIDTFSGWIETFPTRNETAQMVNKKLLEDIILKYGIPILLRLAFISQVIQLLVRALGAKLDFTLCLLVP